MMARLSLACLALLCWCTFARAETREYEIRPEMSSLTFSVSAKLHMVHGKGGEFSGTVTGDPADVSSAKIVVRLDPKTFDTDNEKRDKTMREKSLELDRYPLIEFESTSVDSDAKSLAPGQPAAATVHGVLKLHGIETKVSIPVKVLLQEDRLTAEGDLALKLDDYKIHRPRVLFVKLQNDISIHIKIGAAEKAP